jgi:apolipoprotein N-acyltransferase
MFSLFRNNFFAVLSGATLALSFPPVHWYLLAWVGLVPLLWKSTTCTASGAARQFFVAGWVFHTLALSWLGVNVFWQGAIAFVGYQLLCVGLSFFWAAVGYLWVGALRRSYQITGAVSLAALWAAMEWVVSWLFSGFGWCALGYTQGAAPYVLQWAAVGGVGLVSFFLVLVNGLIALMLFHRAYRLARGIALVSVLLVLHGVGYLLYGTADPEQDTLKAGIYQSNYPQELKFDGDYFDEMVDRAVAQSKALASFEEVDVFVWPEALVLRHYEDARIMAKLSELTESTGVPLFTGTVRTDFEAQRQYNSSVMIDGKGEVVGYYDKIHLAPFGEYLPLANFLPFLRNMIGSMDAGTEQKVIALGEGKIGPLICFEVLFAPMAEALRRQEADVLVVMTNLAWFGRTGAIPQELEIARFRAVETRLSLIHAANTGISGVFDPWGRFRALDAAVGVGGRYVKWEDEKIDPRRTIGQRRVGAIDVVGKAGRPMPAGPVIFPGLAMVVALVYMLLSVMMPGGYEKPTRPTLEPVAEDDADDENIRHEDQVLDEDIDDEEEVLY